jgi:CheY-like chemotaxis protein
MDILMQGVDGLTMLEELRNTDEIKATKVIVLTNLELDNQIMERITNAKPLYFFVKSDITLASLITKVEEELANQDIQEIVRDNEHKEIF